MCNLQIPYSLFHVFHKNNSLFFIQSEVIHLFIVQHLKAHAIFLVY